MRKLFLKAFLCLGLCLALLLPSLSCAFGAEDVILGRAAYKSVTLGREVEWDFPYSDHWFEQDSNAYNHDVARASLGLALSAFRAISEDKDVNVVSYLTQLGFTDLASEGYDQETDRDTISTLIGHKQLPSGETLVVVGICGQGYKNEWLGNLDIGDSPEHKGFDTAAQKVHARVKDYIKAHGIEDARLWMSGYSRSAAVANLTAGKLMEEGVFNEKNAFVYTFATPRATRNPVDYANIFNIVGKFDPVTKVPFKEWGFERHGTVLYTPAQETDSDYRAKQQAAAEVFRELTGQTLWNSPVINNHLAIIESYLLSNIPSTADYEVHMSKHIAEAWSKPSLSALISVLRAMASIPDPDGEDDPVGRQKRVDELIDYVTSMVVNVFSDDSIYSDTVIEGEISMAAPMVLEHIPDVYLSWMFSSDDPGQIFSDNSEYLLLVVRGDANIFFFDDQGRFIMKSDPEGNIYDTPGVEQYEHRMLPVEERPKLMATTTENGRVFTLPRDQLISIAMRPCSESDLEYYGIYYDVERSAPTASSIRQIHMETDREYIAMSLTSDLKTLVDADDALWGDAHEIIQKYDIEQLLSVSEAVSLGNMNSVKINLREVITTTIIMAVVTLLLVALVIFLLVRIILRMTRAKRRSSAARKAQLQVGEQENATPAP